MEVLDAVDLVGRVNGERDAVQAAVAHHTGEAVGVVGLPCGPQDALHDGLAADGAGLQGILQAQADTHTDSHMILMIGFTGPSDACLQLAHLSANLF